MPPRRLLGAAAPRAVVVLCAFGAYGAGLADTRLRPLPTHCRSIPPPCDLYSQCRGRSTVLRSASPGGGDDRAAGLGRRRRARARTRRSSAARLLLSMRCPRRSCARAQAWWARSASPTASRRGVSGPGVRAPVCNAPERERTFPTSTYLSPILLGVEVRRMGERYVHVTNFR